MDWRSISFDWNQVRAFLATVEEGSLSAAARALGQAQPTLGRQVSAGGRFGCDPVRPGGQEPDPDPLGRGSA
ncbi:LysR family transcriptional regulator [Rhodophyticola porphyridii]|uniref:LysR family transcriptional regulator n=1 Tax=Rhodophyticola porphyridii TaxID=1852017 RepID=UPI0035CF1152